MILEANQTAPYALLRDDDPLREKIKADLRAKIMADLRAKIMAQLEGNKLIQWGEHRDPVMEDVTFTAKLEAIAPGTQPVFPTKPPAPLKPGIPGESLAALQDAIKRNFYTDPLADLTGGSLLGGSPTGRLTTSSTAPAKPPAVDVRAAVLAEVSAALDAVEADLLPGTDPGFVVALLRDRIKDLGE